MSDKEAPKKKVGFAEETEDVEAGKPQPFDGIEDGVDHAPQVEEVSADQLRAASSGARQTTFQKMRQTVVEAAQETVEVVSDASTFQMANTVEQVVVAIYRDGLKEWKGPEGLSLSEGFVLMWQDRNGAVAGRKSSGLNQAITYGCMLCDLLKMGLLDVQKFNKKRLGKEWERYVIHPTGPEKAKNFLDPILRQIKENYDKGERRTIAKWVEFVATSIGEGQDVVDDVLLNLVDKKVLKRENHQILGRTYSKSFPTADAKVQEELEGGLRKILLDKEEATPYYRFLLRFMRLADGDHWVSSPFLNKVLHTKTERQRAKDTVAAFDKLEHEK